MGRTDPTVPPAPLSRNHRSDRPRRTRREIHDFRWPRCGSPLAPTVAARTRAEWERPMDEDEHPRGALLFMLVYLLLLASLWTHMYLKLWRG